MKVATRPVNCAPALTVNGASVASRSPVEMKSVAFPEESTVPPLLSPASVTITLTGNDPLAGLVV